MGKVLILANFDLGLYKFRKELIQEMMNGGYEVYISLPYGELVKKLEDMGCHFVDTKVDRRGINPVTDLKLLMFYKKIIKEIKPDLVITYTIKPNIYGGIAARLNKVPYAINITGLGTAFQNEGVVKKIVCFLYKRVCPKAKIVFFENETNRNIFIENNLVPEDNTYRLSGAGVNTKEYTYADYPSSKEPIHFLFIGRVMKEKGVDELFEVAKNIKRDYPETVFDIVGPYEDDYEKIIKELENQNTIKFWGYQEDVKPFIKQAACFVLPSYHEGMANTLLECGAMGRPLITSNIPGCMEAVEDGVNGYLVPAKATLKLEERIREFIELPYEKKKDMGIMSEKKIKSEFDKKQVVQQTIEKIGL